MALKTYRLEVESQLQIEAIEFLTKSYVVKGKGIVDAVSDYAIEFYNKERLRKEFTLVTENELIEKAKEKGLKCGKSSVVQYRRKGVLKDETGPWFFQNQQHKVVYKLEPMLAFLEKRSKSPKSRIIQKELALKE